MSRNPRGRDNDYSREDRRSRYADEIPARVCISNINTKNLSQREIFDWMGRYGRVLDVGIFDRYILIQFDRENEAKKAVDREKGQTYRGNRYDIRLATSSDGSISSARTETTRSRTPPRDSPSIRDRSPVDRNNRFNRLPSSERHANSPDRRYDKSRQQPVVDNRQAVALREVQETNFTASPFTDQLTTERPGFDAAIIVMSSELLRYAENIESKLQRQIALTTHIIVLKEESHAQACLEDLTNKGVLYAFLVNQNNEIQNNCTLRMLYGNPQEHRNMPLTTAFSFVAENFENYQKRVRELKMIAPKPSYDPSRMPPGFVAPDDKIIYFCHLLADSRMLSIDELEKVVDFLNLRIQALAKAEGIEGANDSNKSITQNSMPKSIQSTPNTNQSSNQPRDEKLIALQNQLHSKINNILKPSVSSTIQPMSTTSIADNSFGSTGSGPNDQYGSTIPSNNTPQKSSGIPSSTAHFLQNPSVQQALDTLMHSGQFRSNQPGASGAGAANVQAQATMPDEDAMGRQMQYGGSNQMMRPGMMQKTGGAGITPLMNQGLSQNRNQAPGNAYQQQYPPPVPANMQGSGAVGPGGSFYQQQAPPPPQPPYGQPLYRGRAPFVPPRQPYY